MSMQNAAESLCLVNLDRVACTEPDDSPDDYVLIEQADDEARPPVKLNIGDTVWDSTGTKRGRVVDIEDLPIGTVDPSEWCGASYEIEWEEVQPLPKPRHLTSQQSQSLAVNQSRRGSDWSHVDDPDDSSVCEFAELGIIQTGSRHGPVVA